MPVYSCTCQFTALMNACLWILLINIVFGKTCLIWKCHPMTLHFCQRVPRDKNPYRLLSMSANTRGWRYRPDCGYLDVESILSERSPRNIWKKGQKSLKTREENKTCFIFKLLQFRIALFLECTSRGWRKRDSTAFKLFAIRLNLDPVLPTVSSYDKLGTTINVRFTQNTIALSSFDICTTCRACEFTIH